MKIRLRDDSFRCRLGRQELAALVATRSAQSRTRFPNGELRFDLHLDATLTTPAVSCSSGVVDLRLPAAAFQAWVQANVASYGFTVALAGAALEVLIEKDFPCDTRADCAATDDAFSRERLALQDE